MTRDDMWARIRFPDTSQDQPKNSASTTDSISRIFACELDLEHVDPGRSLVDLGADSLILINVARKLQAESGHPVSIATLFRYPTVAELAEFLDGLRPATPDTRVETADAETEPKVTDGDRFDLSATQQGLWLMHMLDESQVRLHLPAWTYVDGPMDPRTFEKAVNLLVARHDALRLVFERSRAGVMQRVLPSHAVEVPLIDVSATEAPAREAKEHMRLDNLVPFDFTKPLVRAALYRIDTQRFCVYLNFHHLIADGLSLQILLADLKAIYQALVDAVPPQLPALSVTFEACVRAERRWQTSTACTEMGYYWKRQMAAPLPQLRLADKDGPGPDGTGCLESTFSDELTADVVACAKSMGVTRNTFLLAAYVVALGQLTEDSEFIVGVPHSGRYEGYMEGVVGLFLNSLPLRVGLSGASTFREVVKHVHDKSMEAQANSRLPFGLMVSAVNPPRQLGRNPLYSTLFQHADFLPPPYMNPQLDLSVNSRLSDGQIDIRFSYDMGRLTADRARQIAMHYQRVTETVVADPAARLDDVVRSCR
jgi:aryl carrier-like protein